MSAAASESASAGGGVPSSRRFWKPGTIAPGSTVEREAAENAEGGGGTGTLAAVAARVGTDAARAGLTVRQQRLLLPIAGHKKQILWALEQHQVLIVCGETGSGKSTQIPQYLDEAGWTAGGRCIAITQPRR